MGGIGMSGIAELLIRQGYQISGSDLKLNDSLRRLETLGATICMGHSPHHVEGAELVVYSSAIRNDNPEFSEASRKKIPLITRAEMLAEMMRLKYGIAIAGAHGKTTTTSMIGQVLLGAQIDPTIVVGGKVDSFGGNNAHWGNGQFMVVEADESDGSFNQLTPTVAVVTNLDREHMDHYRSMRRLQMAFARFLKKVPFYGLSVLCQDDLWLQPLIQRVEGRKKTYGFHPESDYRITSYLPNGIGSVSEVSIEGVKEKLTLNVPGRHNALNACAALAVADELSIERGLALLLLSQFQGVRRRFHRRGEKDGVLFIDDYAHHPSELKATLSAARESYPDSKIGAIFQPHRYSRTQDQWDEFAHAFKAVDHLMLVDIYPAGEEPIPGIDSKRLAERIQKEQGPEVTYCSQPMEAIHSLLKDYQKGDVIFTLGAGDLPNIYSHLF